MNQDKFEFKGTQYVEADFKELRKWDDSSEDEGLLMNIGFRPPVKVSGKWRENPVERVIKRDGRTPNDC